MRCASAWLTLAATLISMHQPTPDVVIINARIVHGNGKVTPRGAIIIRSGRIERIDAIDGARAAPPGSIRLIDADGKTIIPGLIDAHVHVQDWMLPLFLKHGVTTVRDLHNDPAYVFPLTRDDSPFRPRIVAAGRLIDGRGSFWKNAQEMTSAGEARRAVRREIAAGARVIKAYTRLEPALMSAIVAEAAARGVPVAAHVGAATATEAADVGIASLEHLSGVADAASANPRALAQAHHDFLKGWTAFEREWPRLSPARLEQVARRLIERRVTIVPTLALHEAYSRLADPDLPADPALRDVPDAVLGSAWDARELMTRAQWTPLVLDEFKQALPVLRRFVGTYARLGGRIAAGTDSAQQFVVPGASLHREIELYVGSGLSPAEALRTATAGAAQLLGLADSVGTLEPGKEADLVLLDGDPLTDITATRRIATVIKGGIVVSGQSAVGSRQ